MKRILTTTALVAMTAMPVLAQAQSMDENEASYTTNDGTEIFVSDLMGKTLYTPRDSEAQTGIMSDLTEAPDTWDDVADIDDILIGADGQMASVLVDVGGFLGMGEKDMQVDLNNIMLIPDADDAGEFFAVYTGNRQLMEDGEAYDGATAQSEGYTSARDTYQTAVANREAMETVLAADVTADRLEGVHVYSSNDEWVGEIDELVVTADGQVEHLIIDVGGFLGLGEKEVALDFDQVQLMRSGEMADLIAYVGMTEDQLKNMETWDGATSQ